MAAMEDGKHDNIVSIAPILASQATYPWLLIHHGMEKQLQVFHSVSEGRYYKKKIPEMYNKVVVSTCSNGWLVLEDLNSRAERLLYNPLTMEKIQLPLLDYDYNMCVVSSAPTDHDCRVLFVSSSRTSIMVCRLGDDERKFCQHDFDGQAYFNCVTSFRGEFYCTTIGSHLATIDFSNPSKPRLVQVVNDKPTDVYVDPASNNEINYLVESGGEILFVRKLYHGLYYYEFLCFLIFRADFNEKKWVKLEDIGQRAIFLDLVDKGVCVPVTEGNVTSNCIYFVEQTDRYLYVFDLETKTKREVLPCSHVKKLCDFTKHWITMSSFGSS